MKLQYRVTFKQGTKTVAVVTGREDVDAGALSVADVVEGVQEAEAFLERLTGLRVHIEQVS